MSWRTLPHRTYLLVAFGDFIESWEGSSVRKIIAGVLLALGSFLLFAALTAALWGAEAVKKTPLDTESETSLAGVAGKLNPATGEVETLDVKATSVTEADAELSDDEVVVFVNTVCLVIDRDNVPQCVDESDDRLVSASDDVFATDRHTAVAVNDPRYLPPSAEEKAGLVNKWPFDAEKRDYEYWDGLLGEAVPAVYEGTEDIEGLETYKYVVTVPETPAEILSEIPGIYSTEKEIWVDPATGSIVKQAQHEVRTLPNGDPVLDLQLAFTDEQVSSNIESAKESGGRLDLIGRTVPLVAGVLGILLLVVGTVLFMRGRRRA